MEGILKVTPEKLIQTSGEFATTGNQIKNLTSEMMSQVHGMRSLWQGEAASAYGNKFSSLQQEMAGQYQRAEAGNAQQGSGLRTNVVV